MASFANDGADNLDMLTDDAAMRARLRQLIMDQASKRELLESTCLSDLEGEVDRMLLAADKKSDSNAEIAQENVIQYFGKEEEEVEEMEYIDDSQPCLPRTQNVTLSQKIGSNLEQISRIFSSIFQALLVILRSGSANNLSSLEESRATKRSKDFEVRLGRLGFELKQKVRSSIIFLADVQADVPSCLPALWNIRPLF